MKHPATDDRRAPRRRRLPALLIGGALLTSAGGQAAGGPPRWYDADIAASGKAHYAKHCAACHGQQAEGTADWRQRDASGKLPPPPLNGTAHTWHHPSGVLLRVILDGSPGGQGNMPAWRGILDEQDAAAIIAYLQSLWPDDIYAAWYDIELRARRTIQ